MSKAATATPNQQENAKPRSLWILDSWKDLLLFIATPLLVAPLLIGAKEHWKLEDIAFIVLTFGALGHHAPGLMRAYGDRELFRRYRVRFIVAPTIGILVCIFFSIQTLTGVTLVLIVWGIWHFLMQTYGFARIYDAKAGCFDALTRRLDFALCLTCFATAVLFSYDQLAKILELAYQSGVPTIPGIALSVVRWISLIATVLVVIGFLINFFRLRARGERYSPVKLALMGVTCWFLWFALVILNNVILGLAMFEVYHDVQYLSIVWVFNNNRARNDRNVGGFTRFLFRRSGALIGLYIGLVFAYGSIRIVADNVSSETLQRLLLAVIATSNMLHFYYDGFIWKVRDSGTRKSLGVGGEKQKNRVVAPGPLKHGLKWLVLGAIVLALGLAETSSRPSHLQVAESVASSVPQSGRAHIVLAEELANDKDQLARAIDHSKKAIMLGPEDHRPYTVLGLVFGEQGQLEASIKSFQKSLEINPEQAQTMFNLGNAYLAIGRLDNAMKCFIDALELDSYSTAAHCYASEGYRRLGNTAKAKEHRDIALQLDPEGAQQFLELADQQFTRVIQREESSRSPTTPAGD